MTERIVHPDGVRLCLETFGDPDDPALLLVAGMFMSLDRWDDELCARLAATGRYVVRYDHRDTGRSESSPRGLPGYTFGDLTGDALRVLDALGIERAHLVGISMGGGIAQVLAARHPDRLCSMTLVATSAAGERTVTGELPSMDPRVAEIYATPAADPDWTDPDAVVEYLIERERPLCPRFDDGRARRVARRVVRRTADVAAMTTNHAVAGGEEIRFRLADLTVPTLVVHGTEDPLFPLPHGQALATEIPDATLLTLPGVGHEVPPPDTWDVVVTAIAEHTAGRHVAEGPAG